MPFAVSVYWPDTWAFCVLPANEFAEKWFEKWEPLSEYDYVSRLYAMRNTVMQEELAGKLNYEPPAMNAVR